MRGNDVDEAVAQVRAGVDALRECDLTSLTSVELTALLTEIEVERRRFEPVDQTLLAEVVARGVAHEYAKTSPVDLLIDLLRVRPSEARARITRAAELGPRRDLQGQPLGPIRPAVSAAVAAGEISSDHAGVIIRATHELPDKHEGRFDDLVEQTLVEHARHLHPGLVHKAAAVLIDRLDPDGREPKDDVHQRRRDFGFRSNADGSHTPYGRITPECGAIWKTILDSLAKPCPAEDGTTDPRSAGQRRHDGLRDAGKRLLRADLPDTGGTPITLMVMMRIEDYLSGTGTATTSHGDLVSVAEILKQASDASVIPVHLSDTGGVLSYGQLQRLASCQQRRVLAVRDRGCSFPGCTRPPAWCEAHHIIAWIDLGPTSIDNLTLLCGYHHRHFEALGWSCHMQDGIPLWTPPAWIDREQKPRRNTANHIEIDFDTG